MGNKIYGDSLKNDFKSKGEIQIARLLDRNRISHYYEHPVAVVDSRKTKIWYPDFSLPKYGMIIEYFGVNGNSNYDKQARHKMKVYKENGIEGLFLTKESFKGDWPFEIINQIESILQTRLNRFQNR